MPRIGLRKRRRSVCLRWSLSLVVVLSFAHDASSFASPTSPPSLLHPTCTIIGATRRSTSTSHNVVFTRLSEDCVTALDIAQEQAALLHQVEVDGTFMLLGLCNKPGRAKSTFDKYGINWQSIRRVLNYLVTPKDDGTRNKSSVPRLKDFAAKNKNSMPYSKTLQQRLFAAGEIAQIMGSSEILPEHIFLALLEYKEDEETGEAEAASRDSDCEAMEILWHLDATLEGEDICFDMLKIMMEESPSDGEEESEGPNSDEKKLVPTAKGAGGDTKKGASLLEECGYDLTQQAKDDELDVVYGRDDELESVLRILLRRRKNNPCLIGEPGVGKSSIAEGLAQILVSDKCPALLKGHRIFSFEVSALIAGTQYRLKRDFEPS